METREAVGSVVRDVDEPRRQVLVSFPHDVRDSYDTTFGSEAFRESFERRKPLICWQHDLKEPIGHTISAQVTRRANEMVGQLSDFSAVPLARRAFTQIKDGTLTDASFGFTRQADEPHPELRGVTRITKATMREWSPVSIGSIPGAVLTGVRAHDERARVLELFERRLGPVPVRLSADEFERAFYREYGYRPVASRQTEAIFEKWGA